MERQPKFVRGYTYIQALAPLPEFSLSLALSRYLADCGGLCLAARCLPARGTSRAPVIINRNATYSREQFWPLARFPAPGPPAAHPLWPPSERARGERTYSSVKEPRFQLRARARLIQRTERKSKEWKKALARALPSAGVQSEHITEQLFSILL